MSGAAKVHTIDAVETLAMALRRFQEDTATILEELQMHVNRALEWVDHDLKVYWKDAERRAYQQISEARAALEQARTARKIAQFEPSCHDEKKALERAQRRLQVAQAKLDKLRHWSYAVNRAVIEFHSGISPLNLFLESDLPRGLSALRHMTVALERYVALLGPEMPSQIDPALAGPADAAPAATSQTVAKPAEAPAVNASEEQPREEAEARKDNGEEEISHERREIMDQGMPGDG
jgi:hypothetical protein